MLKKNSKSPEDRLQPEPGWIWSRAPKQNTRASFATLVCHCRAEGLAARSIHAKRERSLGRWYQQSGQSLPG